MYGRENVLKALRNERLIGYLDPGAEKYLAKINKDHLVTTSSCTGRVTIVEGVWPWLRDEARIVYKSHSEVSAVEIAAVISRPFDCLWLKVTGPILHLVTDTIDCGAQVLQAARDAGFKHSGLMSVSEGRYVVELLSAIQISAPLKLNDYFVINASGLGILVDMANRALKEGWRRLRLLTDLLSSVKC